MESFNLWKRNKEREKERQWQGGGGEEKERKGKKEKKKIVKARVYPHLTFFQIIRKSRERK